MIENYITFETAQKAKEKGFNWKTENGYNNDTKELWEDWYDEMYLSDHYESSLNHKHHIPAPTQSLLQKWLREKHNIILNVTYHESGYYTLHIFVDKGNSHRERTPDSISHYKNGVSFDNYEEAFEIVLQTAMELI